MNTIGLIGLGVMGSNLALNIADKGFKIGVANRSYSKTKQFISEFPHDNVSGYETLKELIDSLEKPRRIIMMVKAGEAVDELINQLEDYCEYGDILIDAGNSFYEDSNRREKYCNDKGLNFYSLGVSGGEVGARFGPSLMPSGNEKVYGLLQPILEAIAAKHHEEPCVTYIGPEGSGHYVKMVHNGIEYAEMQLLAEVVILLQHGLNMPLERIADILDEWGKGELKSYLIGITSNALRFKDEDGLPLINKILDESSHKGTGKWTSIESLKQEKNISCLSNAFTTRVLSNERLWRSVLSGYTFETSEAKIDIEELRKALMLAKAISYAQGFSLYSDASKRFNWNLPLASIARIFKAGCIIQSQFLETIETIYETEDVDSILISEQLKPLIVDYSTSLRKVVATSVLAGIPVPVLSNALSYLDSLASSCVGANVIQAQRDTFGAHTFKRVDKEGDFHVEWIKD